MIIKNALIYTPRHTFEEGSLTIREGRTLIGDESYPVVVARNATV